MANSLRLLRTKRGLTLMGLAHAVGSTPSWLTYVERYDHRPGPDLRQRIAQALGVEEADIWPDLHVDGSADMAEVEDDASAA